MSRYADAAVDAGYEPEDENYVQTPSFFGIIKGLAAMSQMPAENAEIRIRMLEERLAALKEAWS